MASKIATPRPALRSREARPDPNRFMNKSVADLVWRILRKGYSISVDNRKELLVAQSRDATEIGRALRTEKDLVWIRDQTGFKFGWMQVNSKTGKVLDFSIRDRRTTDIIASEFLG